MGPDAIGVNDQSGPTIDAYLASLDRRTTAIEAILYASPEPGADWGAEQAAEWAALRDRLQLTVRP